MRNKRERKKRVDDRAVAKRYSPRNASSFCSFSSQSRRIRKTRMERAFYLLTPAPPRRPPSCTSPTSSRTAVVAVTRQLRWRPEWRPPATRNRVAVGGNDEAISENSSGSETSNAKGVVGCTREELFLHEDDWLTLASARAHGSCAIMLFCLLTMLNDEKTELSPR